MIVDHKYNTRFKKSLLKNNDENNFIYASNEEIFDRKKFSKLIYEKFPSKHTFKKLKTNKLKIKNKKTNNKNSSKNIEIEIKNLKDNIKNNNLQQKQFYFNRLKRNCNSPLEINLNKRYKNENYKKNKKFEEKKLFNIFIDKNEIINNTSEDSFSSNENNSNYLSDNYYSLHDSSEAESDEISEAESDKDKKKLLKYEKQNKIILEKENKNLLNEYKKILKTENNSIEYFQTLSKDEKIILLQKIKDLNSKCNISVPYEVHVVNLNIEEKYKIAVFNKIKNLMSLSKDNSSTEYIKLKNWIDNFTKIPFNRYCSLPITINDGLENCKDFIINAKNVLDEAVYGLNDAKLQLLQFLAQLINNPNTNGLVLGIKGPMGTGKTTLIKDGISKILNRPFEFIPLAGIQDGSYFEGHSYTYEGSRHGKIVDILIQNNCMNPIIYGDELDKVSASIKGDEIIGLLTHLTDVTQSSNFNDKYFSELNLNLNKVIYIFSYNDESSINPILRDRMYKIETDGYNNSDKLVISKKYLIPKIIKDLNSQINITLTDENIKFIITNYTENEKGVRNLKRCLETIYNKLNLYNLVNENDEFKNTFFKNFKYEKCINDSHIKILLSSFNLKSNNVPFGMYN